MCSVSVFEELKVNVVINFLFIGDQQYYKKNNNIWVLKVLKRNFSACHKNISTQEVKFT